MKRLFGLVFGCMALVSTAGHGQELANIVGTVMDSSGAVVAGAKVVVANPERGVTRTSETNQNGDYSLSRIPIGAYTITVEKGGYQNLTHTGTSLEVGQTLRVNLELKIGSVSEQVSFLLLRPTWKPRQVRSHTSCQANR